MCKGFVKSVIAAGGVAVCFFATETHALEAGVLLGPNMSNIRVVTPEPAAGESSSAKVGLNLGGFIGIPLMPSLNLEPGLMIASRAREYDSGTTISKIKSEGIFEVPVLARFTGLPFVSVAAGPYFSYAVGDFTVNPGEPTETKRTYEEVWVKRTDFGLIGAIGTRFDIGTTMSFMADLRYVYGLTNIRTISGADERTTGVQILAGLVFGI